MTKREVLLMLGIGKHRCQTLIETLGPLQEARLL